MKQLYTVFSPSHSYDEIVFVRPAASLYTALHVRDQWLVYGRLTVHGCISQASTQVDTTSTLRFHRVSRTQRIWDSIGFDWNEPNESPCPGSSIEDECRRLRMVSGAHDGDDGRSSWKMEVDLALHRPQKSKWTRKTWILHPPSDSVLYSINDPLFARPKIHCLFFHLKKKANLLI